MELPPVLFTAVLYSPIGIIPALPYDGLHLDAVVRSGYAYLLVVYIASTVWFARRSGERWLEPTVRHVGSAALAGALSSAVVMLLARVAGVEHVFPRQETGMHFTIVECYACEAPWDAGARVIGYGLRFVLLAVALSPVVGGIGNRLRRLPPPR